MAIFAELELYVKHTGHLMYEIYHNFSKFVAQKSRLVEIGLNITSVGFKLSFIEYPSK